MSKKGKQTLVTVLIVIAAFFSGSHFFSYGYWIWSGVTLLTAIALGLGYNRAVHKSKYWPELTADFLKWL